MIFQEHLLVNSVTGFIGFSDERKKGTIAQPIDIKYVTARTNVAQTWSFQMLTNMYIYISGFVFVQILYFFLIQSWKSVCF